METKEKKKKSFGLFNFLNVKQDREEITKDNLYDFILKKEYNKNQNIVFWSTFVGYLVFYFTRKQWTMVGTELINNGILDNNYYATIGLVFSISYGIAKFISSPLSDTKSNKWLLSLGLIGAGVLNIAFGFSWTGATATNIITAVVMSCLIQVVIGFVHSLGATPSIRFFYNWFNNKQRRNRIITWNVAHNIGSALSTFVILGSNVLFSELLPAELKYLSFFLLPSIISIVIGIFLLFLLKDTPESVGLPPVKTYYNMELIGVKDQSKTQMDEEKGKPWRYFFVKYVLLNKYVWLLFFVNLFVYTLRMGLSDWSLLYFKQEYNFDVKAQGKWIYSMFDWGGLILTLIVGLLANKHLKRFAPITSATIGISTFALIGIWTLSDGQSGILSIFMFLAGFIYIPQCFLPIMVSEFSHYRVVSTASGLFGMAGYIGDAIMSKVIIGMGLYNAQARWDAIFIFLIVCGSLAVLLLIPMFNKRHTQ
ncbi:glycerol-3-phosphate transporter [Williamsoniiplasma luminosum]|uniref:Glycerol-3-phosphate transporter n=1 Tax=Williamsoniiplasma luminosum TaxID=214888 RepID=A0A2K8NV21_9MOLU|nr:MFS transporter [Williamsoniiplasma luminosum]ATZ17396.1 glycerol-3-phosphate transporter [Williamsoniiplasma luminosum]